VLALLAALLVAPGGLCAPPETDVSGVPGNRATRTLGASPGAATCRRASITTIRIARWKQQLSAGPSAPRRALHHYTTDGRTSISTGTDGDEFHTSVVWNGRDLVFSIEEHEEGRVIFSHETWSVTDGGAAIEIRRERAQDQARKQTVVYLRQETAR
jgi:hypothetical protein